MALLTRDEYKALLGLSLTDDREDAQIDALLPVASRMVETFTGRDFDVTAGGSTAKDFLYDGSGFLDVDDCTAITSVKIDAGVPTGNPYTFSSEEYTAMPGTGPIFYYLVIHGGPLWASSPEMGFERNLDTYAPAGYKSPIVSVTATWGWPAVPEDVKLAVALTISEFVGGGRARQEGLTAEAIEGFSRSWGGRSGTGVSQALAIPNRARDLLVAYQRIFV